MIIIIQKLREINTMHQFILNHKTGTPDEFASTMCMSRRSLYRALASLEEMGAEISYSKKLRSFYYKRNFNIKTSIEINDEEYIEIHGGICLNNRDILDLCAII